MLDIISTGEAFARFALDFWSREPGCFPAKARAQLRDPARVHAVCEQYRAAATLDREHDEADKGRLIEAPTLALWSARGALAHWYDLLGIWRQWALEVVGQPLGCGHFLPKKPPSKPPA